MLRGRDRLEAALRRPGEVALVPYLMAGFPDPDRSLEAARELIRRGAAALELGVPFSDPLADGPAVQHAGQLALEHGVTVGLVLEMAAQLSADGFPVVLMTYLNPVVAFGLERFARLSAEAGVAGVIVPDLPPDESERIAQPLRELGLATIFMVAPTSTPARIRAAAAASSGFVYCVSVTGVTGERAELPAGLNGLVERVKAETDLPVGVGFGISRAEQVAALLGVADAAIVGSAIVRELDAGRDPAVLLESLLGASGDGSLSA